MRNPEQQIERLPHQPPDGRPDSGKVEKQRQRDQRHGDEGHQRNCEEVRCGTIETRPMEVKQDDRHQRKFDNQPGQEKDCRPPAEAA